MRAKAGRRRDNLPLELTSFVGRRSELATLRTLLGNHRAVTLTGPGGVGKSRLALHAAFSMARAFSGGVRFLDVRQVPGPGDLETFVLHALVQELDAQPLQEQLLDHLGTKEVLLLLDGCETLVEPCADLVQRLLHRAPRLRVLSTSRRPLRISGEALLPVPPLAVPGPSLSAPRSDRLAAVDSVALFVDRGRAIRPDFALNDDNAEAVGDICRRLEGLPLALELTANRLDVLAVHELRDRLQSGLDLLRVGWRDGAARHQSLRALVDSSYELCTPDQQLLWTRLSVFPDRLDLQAAEHVCSGADIDEAEVLDLLAGLVDASVVQREEHPAGRWFRLPALHRDYGWEVVVAQGQEQALRDRHVEWCLSLAARSRPTWSYQRDRWLAQLRGHDASIRAALEHAFADANRAAEGLRLASALVLYWMMDQRVAEGRAWLARGLAHAAPDAPESLMALLASANLAAFDGDQDGAEALVQRAGRVSALLDDPQAQGYRTFVEGTVELHAGRFARAREKFDESVRAVAGAPYVVQGLYLASIAAALDGQQDRALAYCDELLVMHATATPGDQAYLFWLVAFAAWSSGDLERANSAHQNAVTLMAEHDDLFGLRWCLNTGPLLLAGRGHHEEAALLLGASQTHGMPFLTALDPLRARCASDLEQVLGDERAQALVAEGRALALDEAVELIGVDRGLDDGEQSTAHPLVVLSARERQVADLVAQGRSNKEIAAELVVSLRTAEGHVQRILTKLDFVSRAQIASWVTQQRFADDAGVALRSVVPALPQTAARPGAGPAALTRPSGRS